MIWMLSVLSISGTAQTKTIDSLRNKVLHSSSAEQRKEAILQMLNQQRSLSSDTIWSYIQQLSKTIPHKDTISQIKKQQYTAYYYFRTAQLDTALQIVNQTINYATTYRIKQHLLDEISFLKGAILLKKNNHKDAIAQFYKALHDAEQTKDTVFIIKNKNGIGWAYLEMEQPTDALKWLKQSLTVANNKKYQYLYAVIYANMTSCYGMLDDMDSALYCCQKGYQFAIAADDLFTQANLLALFANIHIYLKEYPKAIVALKQAIAIRKILNDPFYIISDMSSLSYLYAETQRANLGISTLKEAIIIAKQNNIEAKLPLLYSALAYNYEANGDYKNQSQALEISLALKDSLFEKTKAKDLAEMQTKYETQKQIDEIKILQKENELKDAKARNLIILLVSIVIILVGAGTFTYKFIGEKQKMKLAEEKVKMERQRLQAIIHTQEDERKRISAELHDGIGPVLSAAKLNLSMLDYQEKDTHRYETALSLIDKSYKELRTVSHIMMPATLLKQGIVEATRQLADELNSAGTMDVIVDAEETKRRFSESIEVNLYRIIQELLNNIVKHARPTEVQLQFAAEKNELTLMIEDNGVGFDAKDLHNGSGNGWHNITTRLRMLDGSIEIDSQKEKKGTVVFIIIPTTEQQTS